MSVFFQSLVLALLIATSANADSWDGANNPSIFSDSYEYNFKKLPFQGQLTNIPWSETYWASAKGSINIRWNSETQEGFNYASPTKEQAKRMTREQLAKLAPSEKYDLYLGRYDYPTKRDVEGIATPHARWWAGVCHGWSPAALQFIEPQPVDMVNPDGIVIPFGSSDVKGLLSYVAAIHNELEPNQIGLKCNPAGWAFQSPKCRDVNAGALHVVLANQIGLRNEGFVAQRDPKGQIWNQPVYGYEFKAVGSTSNGVHILATMYYADELEKSLWEPVTGTPQFVVGKMEMDYNLELDARGNIVGGEWNDRMHPDFIWKPTKRIEYTGLFEGINRIYKPIQK